MDADIEQKIKDKLLESLIEAMDDRMGDEKLVPHKAMAVEVAAPDKAKLAEGLDHAKDVLGAAPDAEEGSDHEESEEDDAERLRELLEGEGQDDESDGHGAVSDGEDEEKKKLFGR